MTAEKYKPNFFYIYLPHLDYAAQKSGPDSKAAHQAVADLDAEIGKLIAGFEKAYSEAPLWLVASEYVILPVNDVVYPNRMLREAGLLKVSEMDDGEHLDFAASKAWALVDHQFSHVFVQDSDPKTIKKVARLFAKQPGIAEVLTAEGIAEYGLDHPRSGDVVLVSEPQQLAGLLLVAEDDRAPRILPARSISTASPATTRSSCSSTPARKASRSTRTWSTARTAPRPTTRRNAACCSPPSPASSSAANSPTSKSPTSCSSSSRIE